jgi:ParB family chromosome partitioning protein
MFHKDKFTRILVDNIYVNPYQPRKIFDEDSLQSLSESIKRYGLLQPITVRKMAKDKYELIAGERRWRACKKISMPKIPAIVISVGDETSAELALIENLQRQNLNYFEEAEAYEKLIDRFGMTQKELAERVGKSQSFIANKLRILKLDQGVKETILLHNLSERHARSLLKIKDEDIKETVLEKVVKNLWTVKETENYIEKILKGTKKKQKIKFKIPEQMLINSLKDAVKDIKKSGTKVKYNEKINEKNIVISIEIDRK